jgi:hypothetical protein
MKKIALLIFTAFCFLWYFIPLSAMAQSQSGNVNITATVLGCGDGIIQSGEQCDGSNLNGGSCTSLGFSGGTLSCSSSCSYNTSSCTSGSSGGGGGGGGGGTTIPSTSAVFTGRAYPNSKITLLKDAQVVANTISGQNATFQVSISGISGGNYIFSVYSEDNKGVRSSLLTFPVSITSGVVTNVSGIFIAPTIATDKSEVKRGDSIAIFGQSAPLSEITVSVNSEEEIFLKKNTDANGIYLVNFDSSLLEMGQHYTKSKASLDGEITSFSKTISFIVGTKNITAALPAGTISKGDINNDNKVNLVDFSIAAYWYKRADPPPSIDLNKDNKIDLVDFSIMAFYWTG